MGCFDREYRGFWGRQTGEALEELADFLAWNKEDWISFEQWLDVLERKERYAKQPKSSAKKGRRSLVQFIHQLRYRGAVESKKINGKILLRLTDAGWRRAQLLKIKRNASQLERGTLCLVIFDIPEKRRRVRNTFRRFLKECGFTQLQKSVWQSHHNVGEPVRDLVKELELESWVTVIKGKTVV